MNDITGCMAMHLAQIDPVPTDREHNIHPGTVWPSCHVPQLYSSPCNKTNRAFIPPHAAAPLKNQLLGWNNHVKIAKHFSFGNIKSNILLGPVNPSRMILRKEKEKKEGPAFMWLGDAYMKHFGEQLELLCRNDWKNSCRRPNPACISRHVLIPVSSSSSSPQRGSVYGPRVQTAPLMIKIKALHCTQKATPGR